MLKAKLLIMLKKLLLMKLQKLFMVNKLPKKLKKLLSVKNGLHSLMNLMMKNTIGKISNYLKLIINTLKQRLTQSNLKLVLT